MSSTSPLPPAIYTVLLYDYVDNMLERRVPYREEHLARPRAAQEDGLVVNIGAIGDADSAVLVFEPDRIDEARSFAEGDPYVIAGLVPSWRVTTWNVVL